MSQWTDKTYKKSQIILDPCTDIQGMSIKFEKYGSSRYSDIQSWPHFSEDTRQIIDLQTYKKPEIIRASVHTF